jgi:ribosomal protein L31
MFIDKIPKHVGKQMLPNLKVGALIKTRNPDQSQGKDFTMKFLPAGTVGKIKKIFDFGSTQKSHRFLCDIKFEGHPITNFYTEELIKVKL